MLNARNAGATQGRLMEAALTLYAERGYAGTCLDAILERAASSKGAFYHHFASKEDLTAQALEGHWERLLGALEAAWARGGQAPTDKLGALLAQLGPQRGAPGCPLGLLGFESCSLPAGVRRALEEGLESWSVRIGALLEALPLEPSRARAWAEQLFLVYEGGVLLGRMSGSSAPLEAALLRWRAEVLADPG